MDPESGKKHGRFSEVENIELDLLDRDTQLSGKTTINKMTIGKAVKDGVVDNETLGYFLARIYLFLKKIGVDTRKIRFRQHMVCSYIVVSYEIYCSMINRPKFLRTKANKIYRLMRW